MPKTHCHFGDMLFHVRTNTLDIDCLKAVFNFKIYLPKQYGFELKHGDTVVDLGAYIGDFSLQARQLGARVIAVEPFQDNYELLLENMEENEMPVEHCAYAISDKPGTIKFFINRGNYGACGFNPDYRIQNQETTTVEAITLKDLFDRYQIEKCALLKFDTEGAELNYFDDFPYFDRIERITGECPSDEITQHLEKLFRSKGFHIEWNKLREDTENVIYAYR
jgi:FkbM family methyltransferase